MNRTTFWRRVKRIGCDSATVNKTALSGAFNPKLAYGYLCKFLELSGKLKDAGINSTAELDQLLAILVEMEISNASDLKAYRQRIWDLKAIRGS